MTLGTWSVREHRQLTSLLGKLTNMHRKAVLLSREFSPTCWPPEIAAPLERVVQATNEAVHTIYRERGKP